MNRARRQHLTIAGILAVAGITTATAFTLAGRSAVAAARTTHAKPTIVLVNGAWANQASWSAVIERLQADGYSVTAPPNPLRSLHGDAAFIADTSRRFMDRSCSSAIPTAAW